MHIKKWTLKYPLAYLAPPRFLFHKKSVLKVETPGLIKYRGFTRTTRGAFFSRFQRGGGRESFFLHFLKLLRRRFWVVSPTSGPKNRTSENDPSEAFPPTFSDFYFWFYCSQIRLKKDVSDFMKLKSSSFEFFEKFSKKMKRETSEKNSKKTKRVTFEIFSKNSKELDFYFIKLETSLFSLIPVWYA